MNAGLRLCSIIVTTPARGQEQSAPNCDSTCSINSQASLFRLCFQLLFPEGPISAHFMTRILPPPHLHIPPGSPLLFQLQQSSIFQHGRGAGRSRHEPLWHIWSRECIEQNSIGAPTRNGSGCPTLTAALMAATPAAPFAAENAQQRPRRIQALQFLPRTLLPWKLHV